MGTWVRRAQIVLIVATMLALAFAGLNWMGEGFSEERPNYSIRIEPPSRPYAMIVPRIDPANQAQADLQALSDPNLWRPETSVGLVDNESPTGTQEYCVVRRYLLVPMETPPAAPDDVLAVFDRDMCFPDGFLRLPLAPDGSFSIEPDPPEEPTSPRAVAFLIAVGTFVAALALEIPRRRTAAAVA